MTVTGDIEHNKPEKKVPVDKNNMVFIVFLMYGIALILPWNAICSCFDFFLAVMPTHKPLSVYPFAVNFL